MGRRGGAEVRAYNASVEGFLAQACVAHVQGKRKESARGFAAKTALALALLPSTSATDGNFAVSGMTRESMTSSAWQVQPANNALAALQPPAETPNEQEGSVAHLLFCARLLALHSQRQRHARTEQ